VCLEIPRIPGIESDREELLPEELWREWVGLLREGRRSYQSLLVRSDKKLLTV